MFNVEVETFGETKVTVEAGSVVDFDGPLDVGNGLVAKYGTGRMNVNDANNSGSGTFVVREGILGETVPSAEKSSTLAARSRQGRVSER